MLGAKSAEGRARNLEQTKIRISNPKLFKLVIFNLNSIHCVNSFKSKVSCGKLSISISNVSEWDKLTNALGPFVNYIT